MAQTPQTILEELQKGVFRPFYFLQGDEPYFIDKIADYIENHALDPSERGFNQLVMYGRDNTVGNVIVQARRYPMMAQKQVVIVREAQELDDLNKEAGQTLLVNYVQNQVPSTILVMAHKYKKLDGRKQLAGLIDKKATLVTSDKIPDYKLVEWVAGFVKSQNLIANSAAIQLLTEHIGNDLSRIANELEKIKIMLPEGAELKPEIIHEKVGISKEFNGFEFQKALATRNLTKSIQIAQYFVANPRAQNIIPTLALLFGFFVKVLLVQMTKGLGDDQLAKLIGLKSSFMLKDYQAAARIFSGPQLINIIHQIRLADGYSKGIDSGDREIDSIYKDLIFQIVKG